MKKLVVNFIGISVLLTIFFLSLFYYQNKQFREENRIKIATTIGAIAAIAREITREKIDIVDLSENATHAHEINLLPQKIEDLKDVKVIFAIGADLDNWIDKVTKELDIDIYKFEKDVEVLKYDKKTINPHYWLSLNNSKKIATKITEKLIRIDPQNKDFYLNNLNKFYEEIESLRSYIDKFKNLNQRKVIITHPAFDYLIQELGLEIIGYLKTEEGEGISSKDLLDLAIKIKKNNIKTIFVEKGFVDFPVIQFAKIYNLKMIELDPLEIVSPQQLFTKTLKENIEKLYKNLSL